MVVDLETFGPFEVVLELGDGDIEPVQIPLQPGEEQVAAAVQVVVAVQDAAVVCNQVTASFITQRDHKIDLRRMPCRDISGHERH